MLKNFWNKGVLEAGCDEAGRGCLAGPVFAAAVILPLTFKHPLLNDSKQLTDKQRKLLRPIIESEAIAWSVAEVSVEEIDTINILQAALEAMHRAVHQLSTTPEHLLIDGNKFRPFPEIAHTCIVGGDAKMKNIAAASILAKTYRDDRMDELHQDFPQYEWIRNKGYGTADHRAAIQQHGITIHHRKSFRLLPDQLRLF
ncbi:MAG: ribonuclease HII [Bacteroidetes bacterium]|nr:ribonuclease HII [Bacteroidota bacterium]